MTNSSSGPETDRQPWLAGILSKPLPRFFVAVSLAFVVTLLLIFFMRFLIVGYDKAATDTITRYFTLKAITISKKPAELAPIQRPALRPELPGIEDDEISPEAEAFLNRMANDIAEPESREKLPAVQAESQQAEENQLSTQEKFELIKEGILSED